MCSGYRPSATATGAISVLAAGDALLDYAERKTRAGIALIPDGVYRFEDRFDTEEFAEELTLRVAITVRGEDAADFAGNPPQVRAGLNLVWTALLATIYYTIKTVDEVPTILPNAGLYRPIHVNAPSGTIVNCVAPAAVNSRTSTCQRVVDQIHGALAPAIPERIIAACNGANVASYFSGSDRVPGSSTSTWRRSAASARGQRKVGLDGVQVHITNTSNLPVKCLEPEHPLMVERYELVDSSGGPGALARPPWPSTAACGSSATRPASCRQHPPPLGPLGPLRRPGGRQSQHHRQRWGRPLAARQHPAPSRRGDLNSHPWRGRLRRPPPARPQHGRARPPRSKNLRRSRARCLCNTGF